MKPKTSLLLTTTLAGLAAATVFVLRKPDEKSSPVSVTPGLHQTPAHRQDVLEMRDAPPPSADNGDRHAATSSSPSGNDAMLATLADTKRPLPERAAVMRQVLATGSKEQVSQMLRMLAGWKDGQAAADLAALAPDLAAPMSPQAIEAMTDLIAGRDPQAPGYDTLPTAMADAMRKGLQGQDDHRAVAAALERAWQGTTSPQTRQRIEGLEIPGIYAARISQNLAAGQPAESLLYLARLETCPHPRSAEVMLDLATNPAVPVDELADTIHNWSVRHAAPESVAALSAALSDPAYNPTQQGLAALGLAGAPDAASHLPELQKAAATPHSNAWLQQQLTLAIQLAQQAATPRQ